MTSVVTSVVTSVPPTTCHLSVYTYVCSLLESLILLQLEIHFSFYSCMRTPDRTWVHFVELTYVYATCRQLDCFGLLVLISTVKMLKAGSLTNEFISAWVAPDSWFQYHWPPSIKNAEDSSSESRSAESSEITLNNRTALNLSPS